jgi:bla regulator protein BlaR1
LINEIFNHLWQSTAFAAVVALATLALRRNSPRLRYWLWLAASLKFLIPFSLLVSTGASIRLPPDIPSLHAVTVGQISTYFAPISSNTGHVNTRGTLQWPQALALIWLAGALFLLVRWCRRWRKIHLAARRATRFPLEATLPALSSPAMIEPGIFGLFRPVLLLPEGLADNLTPEQFEAVIDHELRHIQFRDNLTAALHMFVETLFWFHPVVWWIGSRLIDERERDCDEAVLRRGSQPGDYARSIVQVCQTYMESPLPCASGISGSDLKKRIREIMTWTGSVPITLRAKAMLAAATMAAVSLPFVIGILRAQTLPPPPAYNYDAVSIHKSDPADNNSLIGPGPQGGWRARNTPAMQLIATAYGVQAYQIIGAPAWTSSEHFDITFTPETKETSLNSTSSLKDIQGFMNRNAQRLQAVLHDRFGLVLRSETRELPIYNLTQAKGGHKLSPHVPSGSGPNLGSNGRQITGSDITVAMFAQQLSLLLDRTVHDETHIEGQYDFKVEWSPDTGSNPLGPSIFTSITDQLGLKLESAKGPVQVYVVEKIGHPSEN